MKKIIESSPDLLLFTHLVEYKSFTALADRLDMNKSVISKRIKNLENQLKTQLLIRSTRNLELTEAGNLLYERGHNLLDDFHTGKKPFLLSLQPVNFGDALLQLDDLGLEAIVAIALLPDHLRKSQICQGNDQ